MIAEFKQNPDAWRAAGWSDADLKAAIQWKVGTYDNLLEDKMGRTILGSAYRPDAPAVDGETAYKELTEVVNSKEGRIALQRHRTGQSLDARQAAIVARHDALERANNEVARAQRAVNRPPREKSSQPLFTPPRVREIAAMP